MLKRVLCTLAIALVGLAALTARPIPAAAGEIIKQGTFRGAGGHSTRGTVQIVRKDGAYKVVFASNFWLDGAPDPRVAFGNGQYVRGSIFARLKNVRGSQSYTVPGVVDISGYTQVWIWCKKFDSPIGYANLTE